MMIRKQGVLWIILCGVYLGIASGQLYASGVQSGYTTYYVQAQGSDRNDGLSEETPFQTLAKAVDAAKGGRIKRITLIGTLMEASEQGGSFEQDPESVFYIKDSGKAEITIQGLNAQAGLDGRGGNKRVIKVEGNSRIRFEHLLIMNGNRSPGDPNPEGGGIYVINCAVVTLGNGAVVQKNSAVQGGGIFVSGESPGSLFLSGGKILHNTAQGIQGEAGGGIYIWNSSFTMISGEISGNIAADDNGGGIFIKEGALTMTGGSISENTGSGIYALGSTIKMSGGAIQNNRAGYNAGGIAVALSTFTMTGGSITGNTAVNDGGGVYALQSSYVLSGGLIADNRATYGGGVCIDASDTDNPLDFEMTGGTIRGNQAKQNGGGIFILNGRIELGGNGEVKGNTALSGGGVCLESSALYMRGNASIENNSLSENGNGGGIYISTGILELMGGSIAGNKGAYGGGIYGFDCSFTMNGRILITDNTADNSGGGIFFSNGIFEMAEGEIVGNTAHNAGGGVYAGGYCTILLEGGAISGNQSAKEGGGVDIRAYTIVTLMGVAIKSNRSERGGGVHVWDHGVFNMWNDLFRPEGGVIFANEAHSGGGVYVDEGGAIIQNSGTVNDNVPEDIKQEKP